MPRHFIGTSTLSNSYFAQSLIYYFKDKWILIVIASEYSILCFMKRYLRVVVITPVLRTLLVINYSWFFHHSPSFMFITQVELVDTLISFREWVVSAMKSSSFLSLPWHSFSKKLATLVDTFNGKTRFPHWYETAWRVLYGNSTRTKNHMVSMPVADTDRFLHSSLTELTVIGLMLSWTA